MTKDKIKSTVARLGRKLNRLRKQKRCIASIKDCERKLWKYERMLG